MVMRGGFGLPRLDFGDWRGGAEQRVGRSSQNGLRLATSSRELRGPEKYRVLDLKRRRAQIRARRALGVVD
jgi:hypothetical protein